MVKSTNPGTDNCLIDLWEAWVDNEMETEDQFTLHVVGEIYWKTKAVKPALVKRLIQPHNCGELHLEIDPGLVWQSGIVRELRYSECLHQAGQYEKICIYLGENLLTTVDIERVS